MKTLREIADEAYEHVDVITNLRLRPATAEEIHDRAADCAECADEPGISTTRAAIHRLLTGGRIRPNLAYEPIPDDSPDVPPRKDRIEAIAMAIAAADEATCFGPFHDDLKSQAERDRYRAAAVVAIYITDRDA